MIVLLIGLVIGALLMGLGVALAATAGSTDYTTRTAQLNGGRIVGGIVAFLAGLLIAFASLGFTEVGAGQVGVVTSFGRVEQQTMAPGLNWRIPIVTSVTIMDARVQSYAFEGIESFTRENQPAHLTGIVNYHIDPERASELYSTVGVDYAAKLLHSQADTELKQNARQFGVDEITARRDELARIAKIALEATVSPYHIVIDGVFVRDVALSAEYLQSVEQKQIAQQNLDRAETEAETARQQAQGQADAQAIVADGQARANERIVQSLTPELIQWETIHRLADKVRIALVPSDSGFIWNLNGITEDTVQP